MTKLMKKFKQAKINTNTKHGTKTATEMPSESDPPTMEQIQRRAHEIYIANGSVPNRELDDWLQAERELKQAKTSTGSSSISPSS